MTHQVSVKHLPVILILSADFGRNHKAKLWSLEIAGEVNQIPVKISLPVQVVACLRNPKKLKRSKRRLEGPHFRLNKQIKPDPDGCPAQENGSSAAASDLSFNSDNSGLIEEILRLQGEYLEKLPTSVLMYELTKARALANSKIFSEF